MNKVSAFSIVLSEIKFILVEIIKLGGKPYLVGGTVRDLVLGVPTKDIDIEVHGLKIEDLEKCLKKFGKVKLVGKKFGVLRLYGFDIDWSLPRKDTKGRKPVVEIDPNMKIEEACKRRDLTINSMAIELNNDFFEDLKNNKEPKIIDPYIFKLLSS